MRRPDLTTAAVLAPAAATALTLLAYDVPNRSHPADPETGPVDDRSFQ